MHAASCHDLALGIVLLTQRIPPDDPCSAGARLVRSADRGCVTSLRHTDC